MPRASSSAADSKRAIAYHAAAITMLWVVVLFLSIGVWLVLLVDMLRLDRLDQRVSILSQQLMAAEEMMASPPAPTPAAPAAVMPTSTAQLPAVDATMSPSGLLDRGSLSPDGTKFAGFDDKTAGKIGIGVEILATKQVKHIVLLNPYSESTGIGTDQESNLSVRWVNNTNIQYDQLIKQGDQWIKQTKTVEIYF